MEEGQQAGLRVDRVADVDEGHHGQGERCGTASATFVPVLFAHRGAEPSAKMLELARRRLGEGADLHQAGLGGDPLPFPDDAFDDVVACLVLHYLEDWKAPLAELRRVLKPGGRLIVAVNHPFVYKLQYPDGDYFAIHQYSEDYTFGDQSAVLTFWHRPLHAITTEFTAANFRIRVVSEPPAAPGARELFPEPFAHLRPAATSFLCFLFFVLQAD